MRVRQFKGWSARERKRTGAELRPREVLLGVDIDKIANRYGVMLNIFTPRIEQALGLMPGWYKNRSYSSGTLLGKNPSAEIELGYYEDQEKKLASFFHELGHTLLNIDTLPKSIYKRGGTMIVERACWVIGYKEAAKYNIAFSPRVKAWARRQVLSYRNE